MRLIVAGFFTNLIDVKLLSMKIPKFLAFFLMSMLVLSNEMLSPKDGCFGNRDVKRSASASSGLLLSTPVLLFHEKICSTHCQRVSTASLYMLGWLGLKETKT